VPKGTGRHGGAFGVCTRSTTDLRSDFENLRSRCRHEADRVHAPHTGKNLFDRLRHLYAHAMQLDVIFQPIKGWLPLRGEDGKFHSLTCPRQDLGYCRCKSKNALAFAWVSNPVWGKAPPGALYKARALCTLLHLVVTHGHLTDLSHDLARISKVIWTMSQRDFKRLLRRITARIAASVRSALSSEKSRTCRVVRTTYDESDHFGRVYWVPPSRRSRKASKYVPRYVPPWRRKQIASDREVPKP